MRDKLFCINYLAVWIRSKSMSTYHDKMSTLTEVGLTQLITSPHFITCTLLIKLTRPYRSQSTLPHASSQHTHMPTVAHFVTQFNSYVQHWFMQGFVQFHILISWLGISWMIYTTSDNNIVIGSATIISLLFLRARY